LISSALHSSGDEVGLGAVPTDCGEPVLRLSSPTSEIGGAGIFGRVATNGVCGGGLVSVKEPAGPLNMSTKMTIPAQAISESGDEQLPRRLRTGIVLPQVSQLSAGTVRASLLENQECGQSKRFAAAVPGQDGLPEGLMQPGARRIVSERG
jgi:hypothetical protein